jgi:hypothetical protein
MICHCLICFDPFLAMQDSSSGLAWPRQIYAAGVRDRGDRVKSGVFNHQDGDLSIIYKFYRLKLMTIKHMVI